MIRTIETQKSRSFSDDARGRRGTWEFVVVGVDVLTDDGTGDADPEPGQTPQGRAAVLAAVEPLCPALWATMYRGATDATPLGGGVWNATVAYERDAFAAEDSGATLIDPTPLLDPGMSFDVRGDSVHVTESLETVSSTGATVTIAGIPVTVTPPDFGRAVGVGPDGKAEGVDTLAPALELTIARSFPPERVTQAFLNSLTLLLGRTNSGPWGDYLQDEARLTGAAGSYQPSGRWLLTFKVQINRRRLNLPVAEGLVVPEKPGWHYVWCAYRTVTSNGRAVDRPYAAYVERIFERGDFSVLGAVATVPPPPPPPPPGP